MDSIIKRLRTYMPDGQDDSIHSEAAKRIEELTAEVEHLREGIREHKRTTEIAAEGCETEHDENLWALLGEGDG
jgi:phage host-nuclease inhibitor protein Gam